MTTEESSSKAFAERLNPVHPAAPHFSVNGLSNEEKSETLSCVKVFDVSRYLDEEYNSDLLTCDRFFDMRSNYVRNCYAHKVDSDWANYAHHCRRACPAGDNSHWVSSQHIENTPTYQDVWQNYVHDYENKPYYQTYPKFEYKGEIFIWQAKAFHDGHLFLISIRKYCLDRYHQDAACLTILRTTARIILNIYQGYFRSLGWKHNYCKLKFLKHFVAHFSSNLKDYRAACKRNARFNPHGSLMEAFEVAREADTWSASFVSVIANWDVTKNFIKDGIKNYASSVVTEYADRCSILADILNAANTLFKNIIAFKVGKVRIDQIILSINSFYRSLDFSNAWAKKLKATLASIFPSFQTVSDNASRLRELINYLIDGCSLKFRKLFDSITSLVNGFSTALANPEEEYYDDEQTGFLPCGPLQPLLDICDSDLGFMAAKLTTLVASFCAIMTVDGKVPELSYEGLSNFSKKRALPILMTAILAGKMSGYLSDFDKILALMWQAVDSIFKGDFGRFVGVDSYTQIFELYSFVSTSYGGIPPTQDTLSFNDREHYISPVSRMLPMSIINSSDPHWGCMIEDLEGILPGHPTQPKNWSDGMKVVVRYLNDKLQYMVSKVSLSKEMKAKFANVTTHLQALTRNVSTLPSPHKAAGISFIFTGSAGIGKSNALGDTFIKTVTSIIHAKAHKYNYPDIGNWQPGDPIDPKCIDRQRRSNYMLNKQGGVTFLYSHVEDFDPCEVGPVPPENNMVHRIMLTGDSVSANQEAAALESKKGDAVKGDNHYRILAGFYSDNRSDAGIQDLAICTPAVVRRSVFVEWHLKNEFADSADKLDLEHPLVKAARNASDTSNLYNTVTVYTFVRLANATHEFKKGEHMNKVPVEYVFKTDRSYGAGKTKKFFARGDKVVLKAVCVNIFYCYIIDMVEHKYEISFRSWKAQEIKTSLKSESGRCSCPNNMTVRHCPVCAGIHEFDCYTGDLSILSTNLRSSNRGLPDPSRFGDFNQRSIIMSLRKIDTCMVSHFPVLLFSATLRPVTKRIFQSLPLSDMVEAHKNGDRWSFAERGGAFIESSSLDYLLNISAGVIYHSANCLEEWWKKEFNTDYSLAQIYFFLLRYLIFTPSELSEEESVNNTGVISGTATKPGLQNVSLALLWRSSRVSGVDCNGNKLRDRIKPYDDQSRSAVYDMNCAKATFVSITKCLIFDALLCEPRNIPISQFAFIRDEFEDVTSSFFSIFDVRASDYFKDFLSSFVPNRDTPLVFNHRPIAASGRRDISCEYHEMCSIIFRESFWFDSALGFVMECVGEEEKDSILYESDEEGTCVESENPGRFEACGVVFNEDRSDDSVERRFVPYPVQYDLAPGTSFPRVFVELACQAAIIYAVGRMLHGPPQTFKSSVLNRHMLPPDDQDSEFPPTYRETLDAYDNPHSDFGDDEDFSQETPLSWTSTIELECCQGIKTRSHDGSVQVYHDPRCNKCGPWCEKIFLHLDKDPSSLSADGFVQKVDTRPLRKAWDDSVELDNLTDFDEDELSQLKSSCPLFCSPQLWTSFRGRPVPVLCPSKQLAAVGMRKFHGFLEDLRDVVRRSCFIEIPKISIKSILYTLSPIIAAGAFYSIFYKVLSAGGEDEDGFVPHGVESKIPDGENYWSDKSVVKSFTASEIHNVSSTASTSHGHTVQTITKTMLGQNKNCCTSRVVKLARRTSKRGEKFEIHGFCYDMKSVLVPAHFFSGTNLSDSVEVTMVMSLTGSNGNQPKQVAYQFKVNDNNVYFDSKSDLCRIAHGISGISGLRELNASYTNDLYCSVSVDGTYWRPGPSGLIKEEDTFFNRDDNVTFFGKESPDFPKVDKIIPHLQGRPMDGLLVRRVTDGTDALKNGDCGLPVVFNCKGKFPVVGFYIGNYTYDQIKYNCYVPLMRKFVDESNRALFHLTKPGVTKASTIGSFKKPLGKFDVNMDHVLEYGLDEPLVQDQLSEAKQTSGSKVRKKQSQVEWADFLNGSSGDENVADQTDIFHYSGSKSGIHISLPSFDPTVVSGIHSNHDKVRGMFPIIASSNDVFFHPDFLYLGATPWMDESDPHYTFSGELPVGMVGPGVKHQDGSLSSMSLNKEVAKCMVHGHIEDDLVHDAASRIYQHYFNVIQGLLTSDSEKDDDDPSLNAVHSDLERLIRTTIEEQFVGVKDKDKGTVIVPKMDQTSSWGSNNKPMVGSSKRDVYEIGPNDELLVYDSAIPAWEAFTAAVFCFTCGVVPENQITTCFTKRECYPVTMSAESHKYPSSSDPLDFYTALIGEEKAKELLRCDVSDDQKMRDIFHSVDHFKVKVKSRMVSNLPGAVNVAFRMFLLPLAYLFTTNPIEFDMVAGLDMGSCHFEQSTNQIFFDGYDEESDMFRVFDADVSAWDKIMPANLTRYTLTICIELVLVIHEYFGTFSPRLRAYADALLEWWDDMSLYYGSAIVPISVMPSGFIFTLPLNSMMNQVLQVCNILKFSKLHNIPFPKDFTEWVRHKALGDDSQTAIKPEFVRACEIAGAPVYSAVHYSDIMASFGITATMGDKSETTLPYQSPANLVFLQHVMFYLEIPAFTLDEIAEDSTRVSKYVFVGASPLKAPVLVKLLAKQDSSSSVEKKDLLRTQVYTVLGELVPYGRVRWQRFVHAVQNYYDPVWKPESEDHEYHKYWNWNFWLDRYVKKFCSEGELEEYVIHQRVSNPVAFESLKRQINPNGVERLEYDPIF